jgi:hypothetical protein
MTDGGEDAGELHRQRRVAAIARAAANLASQDSLATILDALAAEVLQTDALAAVQILILDAGGRQLRIMGSAGFGHWADFFDRLMECRRRGAARPCACSTPSGGKRRCWSRAGGRTSGMIPPGRR